MSCCKNISMSFSNPLTFGPKGATQFASNASCTYFNSLPPICGEDNHILSFIACVIYLIQINSFCFFLYPLEDSSFFHEILRPGNRLGESLDQLTTGRSKERLSAAAALNIFCQI